MKWHTLARIVGILAVTIMQGLKLPRLMRAYYQVKNDKGSRQTTFDD